MKVSILTVLGLLLSTQLLFAQYDNANLLVQSPDGKTVKLIWFIKKWSSDITGFDIKRKEGLQDWVKLNKEPILPEISAQKKLSIVESDKMEESRIKAKLYELLASHNVQETDNKAYLQKLNSDDKAVQDIAMMIAHDYDLALMNGFAYIDHTVTKKVDYQYGLFIRGTNNMLDSVTWNYGQIPDLNVIREITSKAIPGKNGIQLIWNADMNKIRGGDVAGFNIYREGIRLNSVPIIAVNNKDLSEYTWNDKSANSASPTQYSISAESLFGIEGMIRSYKYDPADHPKEYKKAVVTDIISLGYYFKEGIGVKWAFPKELERLIKGFYVEKDNMPGGFRQVSPLLDPSVRTITDTSASQVAGYIRFRVIAVYNDRTISMGVEKIYNYFPVRQPPVPQNIKAKSAKGDKKFTVYLSWDPPISGDTVTEYYGVYASDPANDKLKLVTENKTVQKNNFTYVIEHGSAYTYRFCISSVTKGGIESPLSDTVTVKIPTLELPLPVITKSFADSNKAVIQWAYPAITDLKGFRLFQNKKAIATEKELNKNAREFTTAKLEEGATYEFTLQAVAEDGVLSPYSVPVSVSIKAL